ncbi:Pyridoxal phosphate homeostasis protein [Posidoniimonas polymericola]|uniref:Pyridoxal phosphate homeostasis protein n=1 Tax=Posidoniimonas polymericola TaxID=2528002 RepID=A0A5C5YM24_9BACT|nr:YggS family pyridoxal phosphate-dependent enzyme [Posidoniimonas polymericola]TWT75895.1 Pyridoxal phosphate homeostasis protein [Posidoniimonas polymericola]
MTDRSTLVRQNLQAVQSRIADAAQRAGRAADEVRLVGVTKYVDADATALLANAGCSTLGESRPQQLWEKADSPELAGRSIEWHLIGHLQRNKVRQTLPHVALLHSIDSLRLLKAVQQAAAAIGQPARALLEVNCSGDAEKHGFAPDELDAVVGSLAEYPDVEIHGLMTMAAREGGADQARNNFALLRELRERVAPNAPDGVSLTELSMGMSGDFEEAIAEGATMVRVGSTLWEGLR